MIGILFSSAYSVIALLSGCSEDSSRLAAIEINSFSSILVYISVTTGFPAVIVPVLSSNIASVLYKFSRLSALLNNSPSSADLPVDTIIAIGVARPSAHGHDITNTAIIKFNANS